MPDRVWLQKRSHSLLNDSFVVSFFFQMFYFSYILRKAHCDLLFVPGGTFLGRFRKVVSMSQNMLPFEKVERKRYRSLKMKIKLRLLKITQANTFKKSISVIFLTRYARDTIKQFVQVRNDTIIGHGINEMFLNYPRVQRSINTYSLDEPFKLLYVSVLSPYKHQNQIILAVSRLQKEGYPVTLKLVGPGSEKDINTLIRALKKVNTGMIDYEGFVPNHELGQYYKDVDAFVYGSTCENMPIILIEAMTAGLPIASSHYGPMPEILGKAAFYFDPLDVEDIYSALKKMLEETNSRSEYSMYNFNLNRNYSWSECASKTFNYLYKIAEYEC